MLRLKLHVVYLFWGICSIAIIPRQHIDRYSLCHKGGISIGGGTISYSFRKLLVVSVVLHLLRLVCKILSWKFCSDLLGIVQIVSLSFLCFVTPYILQTWLAPRINLPHGGKPGKDLLPPLYLTAFLSMSGVILSRLVDPRLWCLNRLGNVITGPPVLRTLRLYNSLTSVGGYHTGRGNIACQTLVVVEYWHMITQGICAIAFALWDPNISHTQYSLYDTILQGCRDIAFTSGWTRVLVHAIFINLMDELVLLQSSSTSASSATSSTSTQDNDDSDLESQQTRKAEMTSLVSRSVTTK